MAVVSQRPITWYIEKIKAVVNFIWYKCNINFVLIQKGKRKNVFMLICLYWQKQTSTNYMVHRLAYLLHVAWPITFYGGMALELYGMLPLLQLLTCTFLITNSLYIFWCMWILYFVQVRWDLLTYSQPLETQDHHLLHGIETVLCTSCQ